MILASSATRIGLSGMQAAQTRLNVTAHNVANVQTEGFQRQRVEQTANAETGGVTARVTQPESATGQNVDALVEDMVEQKMAKNTYLANLQTVKTEQEMMGNLLDIQA
ncbi:flagellar basal body protein [Hydrogenophaga sp. 5NK40-0174]|uniref:flagellar basal body protein n=1 Tax=Hydrogenophaga sp. 5NK40-0174 TaxID=3127649 RepID=UPI0031056EA1